jgi:hypothetical protein
MYVCILDHAGETLLHRRMQATPKALRKAIAPDHAPIVIAAECLLTWSWLADLWAEHRIPFVLTNVSPASSNSRPSLSRDTPLHQFLPVIRRRSSIHRLIRVRLLPADAAIQRKGTAPEFLSPLG